MTPDGSAAEDYCLTNFWTMPELREVDLSGFRGHHRALPPFRVPAMPRLVRQFRRVPPVQIRWSLVMKSPETPSARPLVQKFPVGIEDRSAGCRSVT
jgi:hypothetical protein